MSGNASIAAILHTNVTTIHLWRIKMKSYSSVNQLHKDPVHKKITGVCAGLANYLELPRLGVRLAAIVCLIALPTVTAVAYVMATLLLPNR